MSVLALLLNADTKKIEEKQTKKMEIPRLSAAWGLLLNWNCNQSTRSCIPRSRKVL